MNNTIAKSLDLTERMSNRPYQTLLIAAGVGYVLGGGLFSRLTVTALRLGAKAGAIPIIQRELAGVVEAMLAARARAPSP